MIERIYILESVDLVAFYGVNNAHMQLIKTLFPKLRIVARGNVMKIIGDEDELDVFIKKIREIEEYCEEYNALTEEVILDIVKGGQSVTAVNKQDNLIIHGVNGRAVIARTENQQLFVKSFEENDLVFAIGPAGSGKTFVAIALAVRALKNKQVRKIILSRPAVEAGEKLGFLPGEMKDKLDPYLQPLYDALQEMIPAAKLKEYMENNVIQIAPLAYMRGRTLNDAVIILDEAQNTTTHQIKMFLTRMGLCAKMIVTGDITQIDLPPTATSGLIQALRILEKVQGIGRIAFTKKDIVRHKLVQRIVEAYEKNDEQRKLEREKEKRTIKEKEYEESIGKDGI
ncbi:MAG: PhoH family protein [Tannerella sp.]|jgi:phosphate starvation-inducible PhoH-like protein|nr:PhoH family protein [Tannerella sp.]